MSSTSSTRTIRPARTLQGSLVLPGDKSISHRYAMLAGLAEGTTRLSNFSTGADPHSSPAFRPTAPPASPKPSAPAITPSKPSEPSEPPSTAPPPLQETSQNSVSP